MSAPKLGTTLAIQGEVALVALSGELDLSTAPALARLVDEIIAAQPRRVRVNLEHLAFADSSGIRELVRLHRALGCEPGAIEVVGAPGVLRRAIEILVGELFSMTDAPSPSLDGDGSSPSTVIDVDEGRPVTSDG